MHERLMRIAYVLLVLSWCTALLAVGGYVRTYHLDEIRALLGL